MAMVAGRKQTSDANMKAKLCERTAYCFSLRSRTSAQRLEIEKVRYMLLIGI
jgi:hypothetical protein